MPNPYKTSAPRISRKVTHKGRILIYLRARQPNWVSSVEIERQSVEWGCKGQTIDRRCRQLQNEGRIEKKLINGVVWYRLTQAEPVKSVEDLEKDIQQTLGIYTPDRKFNML